MFKFLRRTPTVLHITHAKAGSTWIRGILRVLFGKRLAGRSAQLPDFKKSKGAVFSVFMTRDQFLSHPELTNSKRFVVIRDLRDTLVSRYFSFRDSHELDPDGVIEAERKELQAMSVEEGLERVMGHQGMERTSNIQRSWFNSGELVLKYEDLIANDVELFSRLFREHLALALSSEEIERAVLDNRFEAVFRRKLGEEDVNSHGRQGLPGDWRNHFTPRLTEKFQSKFGDILVRAGYDL
jgi:hypothetical protein